VSKLKRLLCYESQHQSSGNEKSLVQFDYEKAVSNYLGTQSTFKGRVEHAQEFTVKGLVVWASYSNLGLWLTRVAETGTGEAYWSIDLFMYACICLYIKAAGEDGWVGRRVQSAGECTAHAAQTWAGEAYLYTHLFMYVLIWSCIKGALQLLTNRYGWICFAHVHERVLTKSFVVLIRGNSKSFYLGVQSTFKAAGEDGGVEERMVSTSGQPFDPRYIYK